MIGSYFKLVKHCEGMGTKKLCFVHRSIYEYFVAEYIFISMQKPLSDEELAGILGILLKGNVLSKDKEIIVFFKYFIRNCNFQYLFEHVKKTFHLMLGNGMIYYTNRGFKCVTRCESVIFANMMEIMHLWDIKQIKFDNSICDFLKSNTGIALNLREVNLEGKDLEYASLGGANLAGANFNKADLRGADLRGADLRGAKLYAANLSASDLYKAKINMTKLTGANLSRADLGNANLIRLKLDGVKLTGANISGILLEGMDREALYSSNQLLLTDEDNEHEKMGESQRVPLYT